MALLLRMRRFNESATGNDLEKFLESEFSDESGGLDLALSVYEVEDDPGRVVSAYSEHFVGNRALLEPPLRRKTHFDMRTTGPVSVVSTPCSTGFSLTESSHREIQSSSEDEVRSLASAVLDSLPARERPVTREGGETYIRSRVLVTDAEWMTAFADVDANGSDKWKKYATDLRKPPAPKK